MSLAASYDAIYLAPHLDDGALSCGGQIFGRAARGERVLLVTVFTGDVPAEPLSEDARKVLFYMRLKPESAMAVRRREDREACRELGADFDHWGLQECIYRRAASGELLYPNLPEVFAEPEPDDEESVLAELEPRLRALPAAGGIFAPLTVGGHVDHRLTRRAAERVFGKAVGFYEDYPYVRRFRALGKTLRKRSQWRPEVVALRPEDLAAKVRAIAAYPSQFIGLFGTVRRMEKAIRRHSRKVGGERIWWHLESRASKPASGRL
jgi:LmbE family N-acetylglucosaminyl deacetylase